MDENKTKVLEAIKAGSRDYASIMAATRLSKSQVSRAVSALCLDFGATNLPGLVRVINEQFRRQARAFLTLDDSMTPQRVGYLLTQFYSPAFCIELITFLR